MGRLLGERDGQNAQRRHAGFHQAAEALDQHCGLAGPGTGHHAGVFVERVEADSVPLRRRELDCHG